jgi:uncharacterized protein (DUF2237 family)
MILNVYGKKLKECSLNPVTGYNRDGYCNLIKNDRGAQ